MTVGCPLRPGRTTYTAHVYLNQTMGAASRRCAIVAPLLLALIYLLYENVFSGASSDNRAFAIPAAASLSTAATVAGSRAEVVLQSPPPPPPAVQAAASTASMTISVPVEATPASTGSPPPPPCTSLTCAGRFKAEEPAWADLTFQPGINWHAGGIRGDCVAGELEYIKPKYCSPHPRVGNFPSEERLNQIDVHVADKPKASLWDVVKRLPNRTILLMGDSVMEQFYNTLQCFLSREGIERPNDVRAPPPPRLSRCLFIHPLSLSHP